MTGPASTTAQAPPLAWQGTLLGGGTPLVDRAFVTARRVELGDGAWVDHVPGWLTGADTLFDELVTSVAWQAHQMPMYDKVVAQPRLSAWWGEGDRTPWPAPIPLLAEALSERYGVAFDSLGANLYRDGRDSVAWHGDRIYRQHDHALVAVLSLGSVRRFLLRPKGGGRSRRFDPAPGDLLVMGGTCQRTWQHRVPKSADAGPRISLTLRHRAPLAPDRFGQSPRAPGSSGTSTARLRSAVSGTIASTASLVAASTTGAATPAS